jgi:small multidrug resistance family-3 protein
MVGAMENDTAKLGLTQLLFIVAAALEVGGDAVIRAGMRQNRSWLLVAGFVILGSYGVVVNRIPLDFSRMLGVYVGVFTVVSVAAGRFVFGDRVPATTWVGVLVILLGSAIIHWGARR